MCEYFGLDPQLLEVEDDMFPRFLRGLPKYRLSVPPKRSMQAWCMVIDDLATNEVSFFCLFVCILCVCVCVCVCGYGFF